MISLLPLKKAALAAASALMLAGAAKSLPGATAVDWSRFRGPNGYCYATPAIAGQTILVRSKHWIWAFRQKL